ncbi:hypothetical protein ACFLZ4_02420 [Patescibacteria group bacterium]
MGVIRVRAVSSKIGYFWYLQDLETEQYIKKGLLGFVRLVSQMNDATKWEDVNKMVIWAKFKRTDIEFVDDMQQ